MRIKIYLVAGLAVLVMAGCQTGTGSSGDAEASTSKASSSSSHSEYLTGVQEEMKALDGKIDDLAEKSKGLRDDAKSQADSALAALRKEREVLGQKYDQLMKSSADAWASAKDSFGTAWDQMQSSLAAARSKFN